MSYTGRVLKFNSKFGRYTVVYVLSDEYDESSDAQKITVLTLDDVGHQIKSDLVWWFFYDVDRGLGSNKWEVIL